MSDKKEFRAEIKATLSTLEMAIIVICGLWVTVLVILPIVDTVDGGYYKSGSISRMIPFIIPAIILPVIVRAINTYRASRTYLTLKSNKIDGEIQRLLSPIKVTLPLDKVSSLGISQNVVCGGDVVAIATSSGYIRFPWVQNAEEFVARANAYMEEYKKQNAKQNRPTVVAAAPAAPQSNAAKIKELKELLDSGLISQEEFEQKRKELLNNM